MKRRGLAFWIAIAALLVSAPRLAVAFVMADGVTLTPAVAAAVFAATGVATGVVLTGGNVYIAHALAQHWRRRSALWTTLLAAWLTFLVFAVWLIAPLLVHGLGHSPLAEVLLTPALRWSWATVAALSVELLAAAAMAADALRGEPAPTAPRARGRSVVDALTGRIVRALDGASDAAPIATSAASAPQSAAVAHVCARCGRSFGSQQALAAHSRRCPVAPAVAAAPAPAPATRNGHRA